MSSSTMSFVAIDFETANRNVASVCQVGAVRVVEGSIVETMSHLVTPPTGVTSFDPFNIGIHGIRPRDVIKRGISWKTCVALLKDFVGDLPVIAHNSRFDQSVMESACILDSIEIPAWRWEDTLSLSQTYLDLPNYKLPTVSNYFGISDFKHHDAVADAKTCAQIAIHIATLVGTNDLNVLWPQTPSKYRSSWFDKASKAKVSELPQANPTAHPDHPLYQHKVVITGDLASMTRWQAFEAIADAGGQPQKGVTLKTTMLVLAECYDTFTDHDIEKTGKGRKALEYTNRGKDITFVSSSEFEEFLQWSAPTTEDSTGRSSEFSLQKSTDSPVASQEDVTDPEPTISQKLEEQRPIQDLPSTPTVEHDQPDSKSQIGRIDSIPNDERIETEFSEESNTKDEPDKVKIFEEDQNIPSSTNTPLKKETILAPISKRRGANQYKDPIEYKEYTKFLASTTSNKHRDKSTKKHRNLKPLGWIIFIPMVLVMALLIILVIIGLIVDPQSPGMTLGILITTTLLLLVPAGLAFLGAYFIWIRKDAPSTAPPSPFSHY